VPSYADISRSSGEYPNQNWLFNNITIAFGGMNPWLFYALNTTDVGGMSNPEGTIGYLNNVVMLDPSLLLHFSFENQSFYGENDTKVAGFRGDGEAWLYNGTVVGGNFTTPNGKYGRGMQFDGANDFLNLTTSQGINPSTNFTISAWIKNIPTMSYQAIITKSQAGGDQNNDFDFSLLGGWLRLVRCSCLSCCFVVDYVHSIINKNVSDSNWHFVVYVEKQMNTGSGTYYNGTLTIDGTYFASNTYTGALEGGVAHILIGRRLEAGFWNGTIDEVKIWNRTLSEKEIKYQYLSDLRKLYVGSALNWVLAINETGLLKGNYSRAYDMNSSGGALNHGGNPFKLSQIYPTDFQCFDEQNAGTRLTFNLTAAGTTPYTNAVYLALTAPVTDSLVQYQVNDISGSYLPRSFQLNGNLSFNNTCYLLKTSASTVVRIRTLSYGDISIPNALINVSRSFSGIPQIIDMQYTDITGTATFYLDSTSSYTFTITASGFNTVSTSFQPSSSDYRIYLSAANMTGLTYLYQNVSVSFTPLQENLNISPVNQTLSFTIADASSALEWYGFDLWYNNTRVGHQNTTGAAGGTLSFSVNTSQYSGALAIVVKGFFKKTGYDELFVAKGYGLAELSAGPFSILANAMRISQLTNFNIGPFLGILALLITAVATGAIAGTTSFVGGGALALGLMGMFTMFGMFKFADPLIDWTIFIATTLVVASVMFLRSRI